MGNLSKINFNYYRSIGLDVEFFVTRHLGDELKVYAAVTTADYNELFECNCFAHKWYFAGLLDADPDENIHKFVEYIEANIRSIENQIDWEFEFPNK